MDQGKIYNYPGQLFSVRMPERGAPEHGAGNRAQAKEHPEDGTGVAPWARAYPKQKAHIDRIKAGRRRSPGYPGEEKRVAGSRGIQDGQNKTIEPSRVYPNLMMTGN